MSAGRPADVVVGLDLRGDPDLAPGLDHVGVERPLDEEPHVTETARLVLEDADELLADDLPLLLRLRHPGEPREEPLARVDVDERDVEVPAEGLHHLRRLVLPEEAVVDEDAGQLVAHRLVHEERRDRGVHPAREAADHPLGAHLRADPLDLLLDHGGRRPRRGGARDVVEEGLEHVLALRGVDDLRVELHGVEAPRGVLEGGDRGRRRGRGHTCPGRRGDDRVAVAHPHDLLGREVVEERRVALELDLGLAVLRDVVRLDGAAQLAREELHAVTDPERRDPELEDRRVRERRALGVDRGRAAREHERDRVPREDLVGPDAMGDELGEDARLADAPGDQLAVLPTEVEHEHRAVLRPGLGGREGDDLSLGGNWALPS